MDITLAGVSELAARLHAVPPAGSLAQQMAYLLGIYFLGQGITIKVVGDTVELSSEKMTPIAGNGYTGIIYEKNPPNLLSAPLPTPAPALPDPPPVPKVYTLNVDGIDLGERYGFASQYFKYDSNADSVVLDVTGSYWLHFRHLSLAEAFSYYAQYPDTPVRVLKYLPHDPESFFGAGLTNCWDNSSWVVEWPETTPINDWNWGNMGPTFWTPTGESASRTKAYFETYFNLPDDTIHQLGSGTFGDKSYWDWAASSGLFAYQKDYDIGQNYASTTKEVYHYVFDYPRDVFLVAGYTPGGSGLNLEPLKVWDASSKYPCSPSGYPDNYFSLFQVPSAPISNIGNIPNTPGILTWDALDCNLQVFVDSWGLVTVMASLATGYHDGWLYWNAPALNHHTVEYKQNHGIKRVADLLVYRNFTEKLEKEVFTATGFKSDHPTLKIGFGLNLSSIPTSFSEAKSLLSDYPYIQDDNEPDIYFYSGSRTPMGWSLIDDTTNLKSRGTAYSGTFTGTYFNNTTMPEFTYGYFEVPDFESTPYHSLATKRDAGLGNTFNLTSGIDNSIYIGLFSDHFSNFPTFYNVRRPALVISNLDYTKHKVIEGGVVSGDMTDKLFVNRYSLYKFVISAADLASLGGGNLNFEFGFYEPLATDITGFECNFKNILFRSLNSDKWVAFFRESNIRKAILPRLKAIVKPSGLVNSFNLVKPDNTTSTLGGSFNAGNFTNGTIAPLKLQLRYAGANQAITGIKLSRTNPTGNNIPATQNDFNVTLNWSTIIGGNSSAVNTNTTTVTTPTGVVIPANLTTSSLSDLGVLEVTINFKSTTKLGATGSLANVRTLILQIMNGTTVVKTLNVSVNVI